MRRIIILLLIGLPLIGGETDCPKGEIWDYDNNASNKCTKYTPLDKKNLGIKGG